MHTSHPRALATARLGMAAVLILAVAVPGSEPVIAAEEHRFCITIRSEEPIEGNVLEAVERGDVSLTVEEPSACVPSASPAPVGTARLVPVTQTEFSGSALDLLATLPVEPEVDIGYDRDRFEHWIAVGHDRCDTRQQVLIDESQIPVTVGSGCKVEDGLWFSAFDGQSTTQSSSFDVDHMVPLKEAWLSRARTWTDERRRDFANDLDDERTLRAVSASSNRSKGAQDPAEWLPPDAGFRCEYVSDWVAIKIRWSLSVDENERQAIAAVLAECPMTTVTVEPA